MNLYKTKSNTFFYFTQSRQVTQEKHKQNTYQVEINEREEVEEAVRSIQPREKPEEE